MPRSEYENAERARVREIMFYSNGVFVFGSNLQGINGAGAAKEAQARYGARRGIAEGMSGRSYAIPTKRTWRSAGLPLDTIWVNVQEFLGFARANPQLQFAVTRIACGFAGYRDEQIAPMFKGAPDNCHLPDGWRKIIERI